MRRIQNLPAFQTKPKPCKTDGGHEKTWPDQQKDNDKDKYNYNDNDNDIDNDNDNDKDNDKDNYVDLWDCWPLRHLIRVMKETWPDQQKDNDEDKDKDNDKYI